MARSNPITWRNVNIDNGASAAAFGNSAANFGRTALEGLDIFSGQMQDRITREDTLLTNEAIAAALSGGPAVSPNRRVDASTLQEAVEKQRLGVREERALTDDLLTTGVNREQTSVNTAGQRIENQIGEKDLSTYDERFELDKKIAEADASYKATQSKVALANLEELQRQRADLDRVSKGATAMEKYLYGPEIQAAADKDFEARWAADATAAATATPAQKEEARKFYRQTYREKLLNDPQKINELSNQFGLRVMEAEGTVAAVRSSREADLATQEALAAKAVEQSELETETFNNAASFSKGNSANLSYNGSDWTWDKTTSADEATVNTTMRNLGFDPTDDDVKEFAEAVKSKFKNASAFEQAAKSLIGNNKGDLPDAAAARAEVDTLYRSLQKKAELESVPMRERFGTGDPDQDLQAWQAAFASRTVEEPTEKQAAGVGNVVLNNPQEAIKLIREINTNPRSEADVEKSRTDLDLAVKGLQEAKSGIQIPKDASRETKTLANRLNNTIDVANGGMMLLDIPIGVEFAPMQSVRPSFVDRQEHAAQAADLLQKLLAQLARDSEEQFRRQLNQ